MLWSRVGIGDMLEGQLTPLSLSFAAHYRDAVHGDCLVAAGMRDRGVPARYYRAVRGRLYANVAYFGHLFSQTPVGGDLRRFLRSFTDESIDLSRYRSPYGRYRDGRLALASWGHWAATQARGAGLARRRVEAMAQRRRAELARFRALDLAALTLIELDAELERALAWFAAAYPPYMSFFFGAHLLGDAAATLGERWLGGAAPRLAAELGAAMSLGAERRRLVAGLAGRVRRRGLEALFLSERPDRIDVALARSREGRELAATVIGPFLDEHGVRGAREMELMNPRWLDQPALLHEELRDALTARQRELDRSLDAGPGRLSILDRLPATRRARLAALVRAQGAWAERRRRTRPTVLASIWILRSIVLELARRLAARGVLRAPEEIAFAELDEIRAHAAGRRSAGAALARPALEARRRQHERDAAAPEPPALFLDPPAAWSDARV